MKHFLIFGALSVITFSCSSNGEKRLISVEKKIVQKPAAPVAVNARMDVEIAGMSCEHACGGSIRTALKETAAVDRVSFTGFNADNEYNKATITYDQNKISESQILDIIKDLNDHQFTTGKAVTEEMTPGSRSAKNS